MNASRLRARRRTSIVNVGDSTDSSLDQPNRSLDQLAGESAGAEREGQRTKEDGCKILHRCVNKYGQGLRGSKFVICILEKEKAARFSPGR